MSKAGAGAREHDPGMVSAQQWAESQLWSAPRAKSASAAISAASGAATSQTPVAAEEDQRTLREVVP